VQAFPLSVIVLSACLSAAALGQAGEQIEPPVLGQPKDFSGAVGSYSISSRAEPTELVVEEPLTLTVRITGSGPNPKYLPGRLKLSVLAETVERDFYVEDVPDKDRHLEAEQSWEFVYRLRPKHAEVKMVPRLRFVFYDPKQPENRRFQPRFTRETIVLKVSPRAVVEPPIAKHVEHPERFHEVIVGDVVLSRSRTSLGDNLGLALLLVIPPVLCGIWYSVWRHLYPDAVAQLQRRRGRAARLALGALRKLPTSTGGERVASIVAEYLRQRLDLPAADPTPPEAAERVRAWGLSRELSERLVGLLRDCDRARFAPGVRAVEPPLATEATQVVLAVEAELCAAPTS
jgi:hypothetical protein